MLNFYDVSSSCPFTRRSMGRRKGLKRNTFQRDTGRGLESVTISCCVGNVNFLGGVQSLDVPCCCENSEARWRHAQLLGGFFLCRRPFSLLWMLPIFLSLATFCLNDVLFSPASVVSAWKWTTATSPLIFPSLPSSSENLRDKIYD